MAIYSEFSHLNMVIFNSELLNYQSIPGLVNCYRSRT